MVSIRGNGPQSVYVTFEGLIDGIDRFKGSNLPNSRFNKSKNAFLCRSSHRNLMGIQKAWPDAEWDDEANAALISSVLKQKQRHDLLHSKSVCLHDLKDFPFKVEPWDHQKTAELLGRDMQSFAYLMDQGTGKTKVVIDDAAYNYMQGNIEAVLVLAPNSVKTNWVSWDHPDAIETHMPDIIPVEAAVWISNSNAAEKRKWTAFEDAIQKDSKDLKVLVVNYEAVYLPRLFSFLEEFVQEFRTMIVCDESTKIKNPSSQRTKAALKLRIHCPMARIMTGTPIIKRPQDAYSQFKFLDEDILGFNSFYTFRNHYCLMGGYLGKQVISFQNLDELSDKIASSSYRVMKDDCLDLPPKIYLPTRFITMTRDQMTAYKSMQKDMWAEHKRGIVEARIVLTQQMRLQEITGGYLPILDEMGQRTGTQELVSPLRNPKFVEALDMVDNNTGQFIIWSCFRAEIDGMAEVLEKAGYKVGIFDGRLNDRQKGDMKKAFEAGEYEGLVANGAAGGMGIDEFKVANLSIYISNAAGDTERRIQSEDRTHRGGMGQSITYGEVQAPNTVDVKIKRMIDSDITLSQHIMKDGVKGVL